MAEVRDVLENLGISIMSENRRTKDGGLEYTAQCPHHFDGTQQEHSGSWSINAETGKHICYACDFKGDLAFLIEKVSGVDKTTAKRQANPGARALDRLRKRDAWDGDRKVSLPPMNEARLQAYDDPPDWALRARRITAEAAAHFTVKWDSANDAWVLPVRDPNTLKPIGFQIKGQGNKYFKNKGGTPKSTTLFGVEHLSGGTVIVVESPLDAVLLWTLGYQAVAIMGRTISSDQWSLLISRSDLVILALDNDDAGIKEMMAAVGRYKKDDRWVRSRWMLDHSRLIPIRMYDYIGEGKDPGEQADGDIHSGVRNARMPLTIYVTSVA